MGIGCSSVELWRKEGTGAFNSWDDVLELRRRSNRTFRLRFTRHGKDYVGTVTLYCSPPFRRAERLFYELQDPKDDDVPAFTDTQIAFMLVNVIAFDPAFAADMMRCVAERMKARESQ